MKYIDLVNHVLRRMREDEVVTVNESTYSKMVGDFINDAKNLVEDAWDWSPLRTTLSVHTSPDVFNYVLVGTQNKIKILHVYNDTDNWDMKYQSPIWFDKKYMMQPPLKGSPKYFVFNGVNSEGDTQIDIYPKPDKEYILRFNGVLRTGTLEKDEDDLLIPSAPVIHLAIALLSRERGETGGTSTPEYFGIADKHLADAIAMDAYKHPEETIWYTP
jgi:hypothetical protein